MPAFLFDPTLSAEENIELFYEHLETIDEQMANLLKDNISKLLPFPESQDRSTRRIAFNQSIATALEIPATNSGSDPQ